MRTSFQTLGFLALLAVAAGCSGPPDGQGAREDVSREAVLAETPGQTDGSHRSGSGTQVIDQRSYSLGGMGAFAEMVDAGVKTLALSSPLVPSEMDGLMDDALRIAGEHNVEIFRETDFLVTDLFSSELTEGKDVLLIYRGETLREYQTLKERKRRLETEGVYSGEARRDIAWNFGYLLSYSDEKIQELLSGALQPSAE